MSEHDCCKVNKFCVECKTSYAHLDSSRNFVHVCTSCVEKWERSAGRCVACAKGTTGMEYICAECVIAAQLNDHLFVPTAREGAVLTRMREKLGDNDLVNHPPHYTSHPSGVECIQITEHLNFCVGNAIKYLWRAGSKGSRVEDLRKARWYIDRELQRLDAEAAKLQQK